MKTIVKTLPTGVRTEHKQEGEVKVLPTGVRTEHKQEGKIHVSTTALTVVTGNPFSIETILGQNIWKK